MIGNTFMILIYFGNKSRKISKKLKISFVILEKFVALLGIVK